MPQPMLVRATGPNRSSDVGFIAQGNDCSIHYYHCTKNYTRMYAAGVHRSPPPWHISRVMPVGDYVMVLKNQLAAEQRAKAEADSREAAIDMGIVLMSIAFPALGGFLRTIEYTRMVLKAAIAVGEQRIHHFAVEEIGAKFVELAVSKFIPAAVPSLLFHIDDAVKVNNAMDALVGHVTAPLVKSSHAALHGGEKNLSATELQIVAVHRMRMIAEPGYKAKVFEAERKFREFVRIDRRLDGASGKPNPHAARQDAVKAVGSSGRGLR